MEVVYGKSLSYEGISLKHRGSGLAFKELFLGSDDDIPNNYLFVLAQQESFYSPVHHHNFDQFRYGISGDISILPDMIVHEDELCYHPEGVYYGPQDDGPGVREVLVLQFGGASGQGFLSHKLINTAQERLSKKGKFEKGKFYEEGKEEGVDSFQALWEDTIGRKLVYPKERYDRPIKMTPDNYEWKKVQGMNGVWKKTLGVFSEREARAEMFKINQGSYEFSDEDTVQLFFILKGSGTADGQKLEELAAGRLAPGKGAKISTDGNITLLRYVLPILGRSENGVTTSI
ncbi:hypothetical protein F5884DRAFT_755552 [Xylogone sp. PMI_703]|nr:hypothetical protein F5884DRAFT_755552 [Xylogone sp. PMI_703]